MSECVCVCVYVYVCMYVCVNGVDRTRKSKREIVVDREYGRERGIG